MPHTAILCASAFLLVTGTAMAATEKPADESLARIGMYVAVTSAITGMPTVIIQLAAIWAKRNENKALIEAALERATFAEELATKAKTRAEDADKRASVAEARADEATEATHELRREVRANREWMDETARAAPKAARIPPAPPAIGKTDEHARPSGSNIQAVPDGVS